MHRQVEGGGRLAADEGPAQSSVRARVAVRRLSFSVLRQAPLCRCECAFRGGLVVGELRGPCLSRKAGDSTSETEFSRGRGGGPEKAGGPESGLLSRT